MITCGDIFIAGSTSTCTYTYAHLSHTNMSVIYYFLLVLLCVSFLNQVAGLFDKFYVKSAIMTTTPYESRLAFSLLTV